MELPLSLPTTTIRKGDLVKVKTSNLASLGMPNRTVQGGEGVVTGVGTDKRGTYYEVRMKYGKQKGRVVRRDGLVLHRRGKGKGDGGGRGSPRVTQ